MPLSPGDRFDRYVVEVLLGEGGMGEVYRALDTRLGRAVALKVLRCDPQGASETWGREVRRMLREARIAAALSDPGIVVVYDVGEHEGTLFIAMELVQGKLLRELVRVEAPIGERVALLCAVARVLSVAHRAGLVHRDIKPENVMIREDGSIKVLDFGIARRTDEEAAAQDGHDDFATRTGDGSFVGTPAYMAPEQVKGEHVDARADQFAWGVTAYELLMGRLPFRSDRGPMSLIASILSDDPPPMDEVPHAIEAVVLRALEKEPADRHASMDDIAETLAPFATPPTTIALGSDAPKSVARPPLRETRSETSATRSSTNRSASRRAATNRAATALPSTPRSRFRRVFGLGALVAACLVAGVLLVRKAPPAPLPVLARAHLTPAPTAITAVPLPPFANEEARAAYREGLQALRDGAWRTAYADFNRATRFDPGLTAARLRMALIIWDADITAAREHFRRAVMGRSTLDARDQALLDAHEPLLQRTPSDSQEATLRLALATARFRGDAEIMNFYAMNARKYLPPAKSLELMDGCLELDPLYGDCLQGKGRVLLEEMGRVEEGLAALDRCIEATPAASDCLMDRGRAHLALGRCALAEEGARGWIAKNPYSPVAHMQLAEALFARGAPEAAVKTAVDNAAAQFRAQNLEVEARRQLVLYAIATGRLDEAERSLRDLQRFVADDPSAAVHNWPAGVLVQVLKEMGRFADAGREAQAFLARRGALLADSQLGDSTVIFLRAKLDAALITPEMYEVERAAWAAKYQQSATHRLAAWISGYALIARSAEDAKVALAAIPAEGLAKERPFSPNAGLVLDAGLGWTLWLTGNPSAALPHLTAAASSCGGLVDSLRHTKTLHALGLVREALGDRAGACESFGRVLSRWGRSTTSVTATEARAHAKTLGCEPRTD